MQSAFLQNLSSPRLPYQMDAVVAPQFVQGPPAIITCGARQAQQWEGRHAAGEPGGGLSGLLQRAVQRAGDDSGLAASAGRAEGRKCWAAYRCAALVE